MPVRKSKTKDNTVLVSTAAGRVRGRMRPLKVEMLQENVNIFVGHMASILASTPHEVGSFRFTEVEISAEISASGELSILGTGLGAEAKGGLKLTFKRSERS